jgi:hypothetical protein
MAVSMPRPRTSTLKKPSVVEVVLVPGDDGAASMRAGSTGATRSSGSAERTKPPTWIERWRGKPSIFVGELDTELEQAIVAGVEAELGDRRILVVDVRDRSHDEAAQAIELLGREAEHLAHLAQRALPR